MTAAITFATKAEHVPFVGFYVVSHHYLSVLVSGIGDGMVNVLCI